MLPTIATSPATIPESFVTPPIRLEHPLLQASSHELVELDEAPKSVVQIRGRLGAVRVESNELCLTLDQVQTLAAEGDHA